jgi:Icc-related predicted phosphoesterase
MSDVHGNFDIYRWMQFLVAADPVDAVVLAGDLLHGAGDHLSIEDAQRREADQLVEILCELELPVFYIMGNDDMIELDYEDDHVRPIHQRTVALGDYEFLGYQFSPPFMGGIHEKLEEEIRDDLSSLEPRMHERTVFVTHTPAHGFRDATSMGINLGSPSVLDTVRRKKVRAHIHGHIHNSFGRDGIHFNVASGRAFRAMRIDIDEMAHTVVTRESGHKG